jgi:hypothetical protein
VANVELSGFATDAQNGVNGAWQQRSIARGPDGYTWMLGYDGGFVAGLRLLAVNADAQYTVTTGATISYDGSGTTYGGKRSLFIDVDGYAHVLYVDRHSGNLYYKRGTRVSGGWTWSATQTVLGNTNAADGGDIVVTKEGTGWVAHIVYSWTNATPVSRAYYRPITISSGGVFTLGTAVQLNATDHPAGLDTRPTIDFHHTGDGVTTKDATPHLFVSWNGAQSGANHGLRCKSATYSGGTWTWGVERQITSSLWIDWGRGWIQTQWDGLRWMVAAMAVNSSASQQWVLYERATDGTSVWTYTLDSAVTTADSNNFAGGFTYDTTGNLWFMGHHQGEGWYQYREWLRSSQALTGFWTILPDLDAPTTTLAFGSIKRGSSGGVLEFVYLSDEPTPWTARWSSKAVNAAPNAPTIVGPKDTVSIDRTITQRFSWVFSDPDSGDSQAFYELQYRLQGGSTWTTVTGQTVNQYRDFVGGTFAAGDWEWRARTQDNSGTYGPYSSVEWFTAIDPPVGATITSPANNATIGAEFHQVTWSVPAQDAVELRRVGDNAGAANTALVYWTSGTITSPTARAFTVPFPTNNRYEHVQVRVRKDGLWTGWASARVQVSYTPPGDPTIVATGVDLAGVGTPHALNITVTANPTGSVPTALDLWVRDPYTLEVLQIAEDEPLGTFTWYNPAASTAYEVQAVVRADNGTSTTTSWQPMDPLVFHGVLLHDPRYPEQLVHLRYNEDGAVDTLRVEGQVVHYLGRELPAVEFGAGQERTIEVPKISLTSRDKAEAVRALVLGRSTLCYRDFKGRKVFGVILESVLADTFYGYDTSVPFTVTEYGGMA